MANEPMNFRSAAVLIVIVSSIGGVLYAYLDATRASGRTFSRQEVARCLERSNVRAEVSRTAPTADWRFAEPQLERQGGKAQPYSKLNFSYYIGTFAWRGQLELVICQVQVTDFKGITVYQPVRTLVGSVKPAANTQRIVLLAYDTDEPPGTGAHREG